MSQATVDVGVVPGDLETVLTRSFAGNWVLPLHQRNRVARLLQVRGTFDQPAVTPRSCATQLLWKVRIDSSRRADFLSELYRIKSIELKGDEGEPKNAVITFEKHPAARTALMVLPIDPLCYTLTHPISVERRSSRRQHAHRHLRCRARRPSRRRGAPSTHRAI